MIRHARRGGPLTALLLIAAACTGGSSDGTTTTLPPASSTTSTSSTTIATTTTTEPLIQNGPPLIDDGDRGGLVEAVQVLLNCSDYGPLDEDGIFGPATASEIAEFQRTLGRVESGRPDDETFAELSRNCDEARRIIIDPGGEEAVAGNAVRSDPDVFFLRADEDSLLTISVVSLSGEAVVDVRGSDGATFDESVGVAWSGSLPSTQDYAIEVSSRDDPATYLMTVALPALADQGSVAAAADQTVVLDGLERSVSSVCVDTSGVDSFVAETDTGYLVVAAGSPGSRAVDLGGIGAPVEFVFKDGSAGYHGFADDLAAELGDDAVTGSARVFLRQPGGSDEPFDLAFDFPRSVVPCSGGAATSIVLRSDGLGIVTFGSSDVETLLLQVQAALPGSSAPADTGWQAIDPATNAFGVCRDGTSEVRLVTIANLTLYFTNGGTSFASQGTRHFAAWRAAEGLFPFATAAGAGPGDTVTAVLAAHPDAIAVGDGPVTIYVSSPPESDRWLSGTSSTAGGGDDVAAVVDTFNGGRFCDL